MLSRQEATSASRLLGRVRSPHLRVARVSSASALRAPLACGSAPRTRSHAIPELVERKRPKETKMNTQEPARRSIPQSAGPWDRPGTVKFYGGPFSNFASTPGLRLPEGWSGPPQHPARVEVPTVEHYFQACKACDRDDFLWILSAPKASQAKRRGGAGGEGGRKIELRPDWEE